MTQGAKQRSQYFPVEQWSLVLQASITKEAVHALDRMLGVSRAGHGPAQIGQGQAMPMQLRTDAAHQGAQSLAVDRGECLENALCKNRTACMSLGGDYQIARLM
ncbi:hypothetical protein BVH01_12480 [Pseudomonas sp. PA1(2017)]|nr:hypothetical protein BVH01_12480 [Pseudomonas sp. PA1(2017)]